MHETAKRQQKALVVVVITKNKESKNRKLDEIIRLAESTGIEVIGSFSQNIKEFNKGTVIGSGKIIEIQNLTADFIFLILP